MGDIFMRFPQGKPKALTLSYDDGVEQDIRLMELMNQYGIKGTFNLNSGLFAEEGTMYPKGQIHRRMTTKAIFELFKDSGQEIAVHTLTHPHLESLPVAAVLNEVLEDRKRLEEMFGVIVRGMAYPFGTYNDVVVEALKMADIVYARTTKSTECFDIPDDLLRLPATCHHNNPRLMELADEFIDNTPLKHPYLFYLWGHSYEFEKDNNWHVIEEFFEKVSYREDVWYATNIEIFQYIEAFNRLEYSVNTRIIKNPSACDIYINHSGKDMVIPGSQCVRLE